MTDRTGGKTIQGWRVLIPRSGRWADELALRLLEAGAEPVLVPLIEFTDPDDPAHLERAVANLNAGQYDWLLVTSTTAIDALARAGAIPPPNTRIAVLGEITEKVARESGWNVTFRPQHDHSPGGIVAEWPNRREGGRVLLPQSQVADETLLEGLSSIGLQVDRVTAFRATAVAVPGELAVEVAEGHFDAIAITAGSIAARVADEFAPLPKRTRVVCIGPRTAGEATTSGLSVAAIAADRTGAAVVAALEKLAQSS